MRGRAAEMRRDLEFVGERDEAGRRELTDAEYERCLGKIQEYARTNRGQGGRFGLAALEVGAGA
eukprot:9097956-Pyramimonas_sp.AAC.1